MASKPTIREIHLTRLKTAFHGALQRNKLAQAGASQTKIDELDIHEATIKRSQEFVVGVGWTETATENPALYALHFRLPRWNGKAIIKWRDLPTVSEPLPSMPPKDRDGWLPAYEAVIDSHVAKGALELRGRALVELATQPWAIGDDFLGKEQWQSLEAAGTALIEQGEKLLALAKERQK